MGMGDLWLIWGDADTARIREGVRMRCPEARIVSVDDASSLMDLVREFGSGARVAIAARSGGAEGLFPVIEGLRAADDVRPAPEVLVFIDEADAECVPRLFDAGVREVIATGASRAEGADALGCDAGTAHMDIGMETASRHDGPPGCDGLRAAGGPGPQGGADEEAPPWHTADWDVLDEPEWMAQVGTEGEGETSGEVIDLADTARRVRERGTVEQAGPRAPIVTVVSGQGGAGKTTLVAAMATCAARAGLRAAVVDADLMFGDLPSVLGVDSFRGLDGIDAHAVDGELAECDIESCAMRVGPGLTLWGPLIEPERAELYGGSLERLLEVLRKVADVVFVDTSTHWGDAVAAAVALCDRCLVVGSSGANAAGSAARVVGLVTRLGVPATRMTSVFNRCGAHGCMEEDAMRFEMGASLGSRVRISMGGDEVSGLMGFGRLDALISGEGPFARDVRDLTARMLAELGCVFDGRLMGPAPAEGRGRLRLRLPWRRAAGDRP